MAYNHQSVMECYVVVFFLFLLGFYFEHFFLEQLALSSSEMNRELIEKIIIIKKKEDKSIFTVQQYDTVME